MAPNKKQTRKGMGRTPEGESKTGLHWKDVLLAIYNDELIISSKWDWETNIVKDNPWWKKSGLSEQEFLHSLVFLKDNGLIRSRKKWPITELTEKGFDVAGKIEERRETFLHRLSSIFLTWVLVLTLLITLIYQMNLVEPILLLVAYIIALLAALDIFRRKSKPTKK